MIQESIYCLNRFAEVQINQKRTDQVMYSHGVDSTLFERQFKIKIKLTKINQSQRKLIVTFRLMPSSSGECVRLDFELKFGKHR